MSDDNIDVYKVNTSGSSFAKSLINKGDISESSWSFSSADGNKLLGTSGDDWAMYKKMHLAVNSDAEENTKARYAYPFGKLVGGKPTIFRKAVIAAKAAASGARGAQKNTAIINTADSLLQKINTKLGIEDEEDLCGTKKKRKMSNDIMHIDYIDDFMQEKFVMTPEGFLNGRAIVTNIGVFPYLNEDGSIRYELRPPEEVFDRASLDSLKMKPLTNDHPDVLVNADNYKEFAVGNLGNGVITDPYHVSIDMSIQEKKAIQDVQNGKRALSLGYKTDLEKAQDGARWMGIPYDYIQRNIRYNHSAIVDRGRAGDAVTIKMDGVDNMAIMVRQDNKPTNNIIDKSTEKERNMPDLNLKKIELDGVEYQGEAKVLETLNKYKASLEETTSKLDESTSNLAKAEGERDALKEKVDQLTKELENSIDKDKFSEAVEKRIKLLDAAKKAEVEVKADMSERDIQIAVINKISKKDISFEGKDDLYVKAYFDSKLEDFKEEKKIDAENNAAINGANLPKNQDEKTDSDTKHDNWVKNIVKKSREV